MTGAVDEPDVATVAPVLSVLREQILDKAEYRRDAGSGGDEDAVGERLPECEEPVWPVELKGLADFQVAEQIRKEAVLHAVYTQVEHVCAGRRGDGVCARLRFSPVIGCDAG